MNLLVETPSKRDAEREYILSVVLTDFLGLSWRRKIRDGKVVRISLPGARGEIVLPDILFSYSDYMWLKEKTLPVTPLPIWDTTEIGVPCNVTSRYIPVIYGDGTPRANCSTDTIYLPIDVFGSAFFMITRYEELAKPDRDIHNRFPAHASLAYQEGFLERPIVDEYVEILWSCMNRLWPELRRKTFTYKVFLSHDVDLLSVVDQSWLKVLRSLLGDVVYRKNLNLAYRRLKAKLNKDYTSDPYNTFSFIMDLSEHFGLKSAFYFKTGASNTKFDEKYNLNLPWVSKVLQEIHERGHEIGLHTSYDAYKDPERTREEFEALLKIARKLKIEQQEWGGRQHFLRWENPTTWAIWDEAGLDYDSTLGFADYVGFRCGTCREFRVFDLIRRRPLRLREIPLIVMEGTLLSRRYMRSNSEKAYELIMYYSNICRKFKGVFSLVWHNSSLAESWQKQLYLKVLQGLQNS